jgi:hypothetical protein
MGKKWPKQKMLRGYENNFLVWLGILIVLQIILTVVFTFILSLGWTIGNTGVMMVLPGLVSALVVSWGYSKEYNKKMEKGLRWKIVLVYGAVLLAFNYLRLLPTGLFLLDFLLMYIFLTAVYCLIVFWLLGLFRSEEA